MNRLANWRGRQFAQLWLVTVLLSAVILVLPAGRSMTFWLIPYPSWNPVTWFQTLGLLLRANPRLTIAVLLPVVALIVTCLAGLSVLRKRT